MKQFFGLFVLAMLVFSCNSDQSSSSSGGGKNLSTALGSAKPPELPAMKYEEEVKALTMDFWIFEHYIITGDREASLFNKGKWFQFYTNGTFKNGHWEEDTGEGTFFLKDGPMGAILTLDNVDDSQDAEYEIQGINPAKDEMSWVGTGTYGNNKHFAKPLRLYTKPTKAQFGVE
ncbi:MAG: hypothetical protein AAFO07_34290 [Bacteroidota bacterium]